MDRIIRRDLKTFPKQVRSDIGQALYTARMGETDPAAKPRKGFGGARVMEIIDRYDANTYRAAYTVQFFQCDLRAACLPEEIQERHCDPAKGH
ncbi:MAG: type II toxin-antitoxin system RelE/ParE family toxin [Candidatus Binatia bacterium]